jgi:hypothetical protein
VPTALVALDRRDTRVGGPAASGACALDAVGGGGGQGEEREQGQEGRRQHDGGSKSIDVRRGSRTGSFK